MRRQIRVAVLCAGVALLITACCPQNPPLNSVRAAHGNTDWHIDTAEEFLFGHDMGGAATAANHCPDTWDREHIHVGLTNTSKYYHDRDVHGSGRDHDSANGIDRSMLFFYAGHGWPEGWNTLGNNATQEHMRIGDCPWGRLASQQGLLRYYWQCSCRVFAHGPRDCPGETFDYACPQDFDGSADSEAMRNVYERWGPALDPALRMACGSSTPAYCHETQMNRIWDRYNNLGFDVADSFIDGLNMWGVVPLGITVGASDVTATPLYDLTFTSARNTSGWTHYHIQFPAGFASTPRFPKLIKQLPKLLPILKIKPMPLPDPLRDAKLRPYKDFLVSQEQVKGRGPRVRVHPASGAVYIHGPRKATATEKALDERLYLQRAMAFVKQQGWTARTASEPMGVRHMLQTMARGGKREDIRHAQKNVTVTLKRILVVDNAQINVLGDGGVIRVQMNNDGTILNAAKVWRALDGEDRRTPIKTYQQAYQEALKQLPKPDAYKLDRWTWGYKEHGGSVAQRQARVVFQFGFVAEDPRLERDHPPQFIEVPGHVLRAPARPPAP